MDMDKLFVEVTGRLLIAIVGGFGMSVLGQFIGLPDYFAGITHGAVTIALLVIVFRD